MAATAHTKQPGVDVTVVVTAAAAAREGTTTTRVEQSRGAALHGSGAGAKHTDRLAKAALHRPARVLAKALRLQRMAAAEGSVAHAPALRRTPQCTHCRTRTITITCCCGIITICGCPELTNIGACCTYTGWPCERRARRGHAHGGRPCAVCL